MLKCVLLDANIIIEAYHLGIWAKLIERVEICVSSIVAHTEALFYIRKEKRVPEAINLKNLIAGLPRILPGARYRRRNVKSSESQEKPFPHLNIGHLKRHAGRWVTLFKDVPITNITLFHGFRVGNKPKDGIFY